ncbi:hypothetical protein GN244_ATG09667 [Phytophthora infestans]|uniref:Uncharacterized protein n=1 Tax=Phytophthora infestans TaxID=4787 RepID=A0A833TBM1_PHYIN|nr:hypothetical protein GN244_ATG09667 [Phytophthora infestans]
MYDVYGSSEDRTDEDRLARMELWLHIFAEKAGDCLEEDGGNSDDSAVSMPTSATPAENPPAPISPAAASPPQTADDPPSSNEPSAESELAITEPAVTESPKSKRRVTKRGAPAKRAAKRPHRSTHNSAKQTQKY